MTYTLRSTLLPDVVTVDAAVRRARENRLFQADKYITEHPGLAGDVVLNKAIARWISRGGVPPWTVPGDGGQFYPPLRPTPQGWA